MSEDDVLFGYRLRVLDHASRTSVSEACRVFGIHRSTYYGWKRRIERHGLEILRPRERRRPRQPKQLSPLVEERIVAFALGHPGLGPKRSPPSWARSAVVTGSDLLRVGRRRASRVAYVAGVGGVGAGGSSPSISTRGIHASHAGRYQLRDGVRPPLRVTRGLGGAARPRVGYVTGVAGRAATCSSPSISSRGIQPSQLGRYQFQRPSSCIAAGTSTERTIVASISNATATPNPICWNITRSPCAKPRKTATMISAAPVMMCAVELIPHTTASLVFPVLV